MKIFAFAFIILFAFFSCSRSTDEIDETIIDAFNLAGSEYKVDFTNISTELGFPYNTTNFLITNRDGITSKSIQISVSYLTTDSLEGNYILEENTPNSTSKFLNINKTFYSEFNGTESKLISKLKSGQFRVEPQENDVYLFNFDLNFENGTSASGYFIREFTKYTPETF